MAPVIPKRPALLTALVTTSVASVTARATFDPVQCGRVWVAPASLPASVAKPAGAVEVRLDADDYTFLVTSAGNLHQTTRTLLEWLDTLDASNDAVCLDYGCGSGVLGIAAVRLGACTRAVMADITPSAVEWARANARANGVEAHCSVYEHLSSSLAPRPMADILVANMLPGPLCCIALDAAARIQPFGRVALTGFKEADVPAVRAAFGAYVELDDLSPACGVGGDGFSSDAWVRLTGWRTEVVVSPDAFAEQALL